MSLSCYNSFLKLTEITDKKYYGRIPIHVFLTIVFISYYFHENALLIRSRKQDHSGIQCNV